MPIIPKYQSGGVKRLATPDINQPLREQAAMGRVLDQARGIAREAKATHDKYASDKATAGMTAAAHQLELDNANKPFYSADEVPDDIGVRKTDVVTGPDGAEVESPRTNIPSYEVYPKLLDSSMQAHIESNSANLPRSVRNNWKLNAEQVKGRMNQAVMLDSARQQQAQIRIDQDANFKEAMLNRDYTTAVVIANSYNGSDSERQSLVNVATKGEEKGDYHDEMAEEDIPAMTASLAYLMADDYEGKGRLDPRERDAMVRALKSKLSQLNQRGKSGREAKNLQIKHDAKNLSDRMEKGYVTDPEEVIDLDDRLDFAWGQNPEGKLAETKFNWDKTTKNVVDYNQFARLATPAQEAVLAKMPTSTGDEIASKRKFEQVMENGTKERADDSMSYAENVGLVEKVNLDYDNLVTSLADRQLSNNIIKSVYGSSSGPLKKGEAEFISSKIKDMQVQEKLGLFGEMQVALGSEATSVYQQIDPKGTDPNMSAGLLVSQGRSRAGQYLLQGNAWAKDNPTAVPKRGEMRDAYADSVGGTFAALSSEQRRSVSGITDIYSGLSQEAGDVTGAFDQDRFDLAVEEYTGGLGEVGDRKIQLPQGWTQNEVSSHLTRLDPEYWNTTGGVQGYQDDYDQLTKDIDSGTVSLVQNGQNMFLLYSNVTNSQLLTPEGKAATFSFSHDSKLKSTKIGRRRRR